MADHNQPVASESNQGRSDRIGLGDFLKALRRDFDASLDGDTSITFELGLKVSVQMFGIASRESGTGLAEVQIDFNEGKQPVALDLTIKPSALTMARIAARAKVVQDTIIRDAQAAVLAVEDSLNG
jgi:hypothetical protein